MQLTNMFMYFLPSRVVPLFRNYVLNYLAAACTMENAASSCIKQVQRCRSFLGDAGGFCNELWPADAHTPSSTAKIRFSKVRRLNFRVEINCSCFGMLEIILEMSEESKGIASIQVSACLSLLSTFAAVVSDTNYRNAFTK